MPALIRKLAILGTVFYTISGLFSAPAYAQTPSDTGMPTMAASDALPSPDALPDALPSPDAPAAPDITPPSMETPTTPTPATPKAATHHKKAHSKKHKATKATKKPAKTAKKSKGDERVREAQAHLINLGYYKDKADGIIGPKTRAALRKFQHDHKLRVDGRLSKQTYEAILAEDKGNPIPAAALEKSETETPKAMSEMAPPQNIAPPPPDFYATHPDFYGYYDQDFENALLLGPQQTLYSRFAKVDLTEDSTQNGLKRYNVMLNGLPLVLVDGQPSVVGVSKTFQMGDEDVMIFTSYRDRNPICAYDYNLLILNANGTSTREISNCTRGYKVKMTNGSLFITFPEASDANRAVGNTWRYEKGDLERL